MLIDFQWLLSSFSDSFFECTDPNNDICSTLVDLQIKISLTLFVKPIFLRIYVMLILLLIHIG